MKNKYLKTITGQDGVTTKVDVYDVLVAFGVTCPARGHAIKKLLCAGGRGHKDALTDLKEAVVSSVRALRILKQQIAAHEKWRQQAYADCIEMCGDVKVNLSATFPGKVTVDHPKPGETIHTGQSADPTVISTTAPPKPERPPWAVNDATDEDIRLAQKVYEDRMRGFRIERMAANLQRHAAGIKE